MINKRCLKRIVIVVTVAAMLLQVETAIAAEDPAATDEITTETEETEETQETQGQENLETDLPETDIPEMEEQPEDDQQEETEISSDVDVPEEGEETAEELQPEETEYKTDFVFENEEVKITAKALKEAKLPENTEMKAVKLEEGSEAYEDAKRASAQALGTDENAQYCFYDVTFVVDGQEIKPDKGMVTIQMEFKNIQVDAEAQTQNIIHIEDTEAGKQVEDVTSAAENGSNLKSVDFAM